MKWYRLYKESDGGLTKDEFDKLFYDYVDVADEFYCQEGYKSKNANMLNRKMEEFIDNVKSNVSREYKHDDPEWERHVSKVIDELDDIINDGNDDWIEGKKRQLWYDFIAYKSLAGANINESRITGAGRVDFDDDLVAVYTPDGKLEYKGIFDDCPYKDDDMRYDKTTMTYRIEGPNGDYRTMAKLAESCRESSRFGFKVGDRVVLTKDKSNRFSGDFIPAGTEGEIVAVDKPMPGVMKVKIEDWKTISVPERGLKLAGTDNEPWEKYKVPAKPKPSLKEILDKHGPEEIYNEPPPADGSPKWTGD